MIYRPEIDGLRALAVLAVIFFHCGYDWCSGGFIGVDIFFVISGYLISSIIIRDIEAGNFSLVHFYERRARRILPALFVVTFVCVPFSWLFLESIQMEDFGKSLMAVASFSSNILFWYESGYFAPAAGLKPLLHTWSLAVEEQYYLLYPIFILAMYRWRRKNLFYTILVLIFSSLLAAHWLLQTDPLMAFFLLPSRVWEMLIGACCCLLQRRFNDWFTSGMHQFLSVLGMVLIIFSAVCFHEWTPTPGYITLVPNIGAALVILSAHNGNFIKKVLSSKLLVRIGLFSYSAYLWHHPILAFSRIVNIDTQAAEVRIVFVLASLLLGWLSWRFIEQPFRKKTFLDRRKVFSLSLLGSLLLFAMGYVIVANAGFATYETPALYKIKRPLLSQNMYTIGDSHAGHLAAGLRNVSTGRLQDRTYPGCIPFYGVDRFAATVPEDTCVEKVTGALDEFAQAPAGTILFLTSMGPFYLEGTSFVVRHDARLKGYTVKSTHHPHIKDPWLIYELGMRETFEILSKLENKKVIFIVDIPELGIANGCENRGKTLHLGSLKVTDLLEAVSRDDCKVARASYEERSRRYRNLIFKNAKDFPKIIIFDSSEVMCDTNWCHGYLSDIGRLYRNADHLSYSGSNYLVEKIAEHLAQTLK